MFSPSAIGSRSLPATPSPFWASEGRRSHLHQGAQAPQVVGRGLPVQVQRRTRQADAAQHLATHLLQAGEHVLDTSTPRRGRLYPLPAAEKSRLLRQSNSRNGSVLNLLTSNAIIGYVTCLATVSALGDVVRGVKGKPSAGGGG